MAIFRSINILEFSFCAGLFVMNQLSGFLFFVYSIYRRLDLLKLYYENCSVFLFLHYVI